MRPNFKMLVLILVPTLLVVVAAFLFFFKKPSTTNVSPEKTPSSSSSNKTSFPTDTPFTIPSKDASKMTVDVEGNKIEMNNLYKNPVETFPGNNVAFAENDQYHMLFYPKNKGFIIIILDKNIQAGRDKAENDFLTTLGVTKEQACKLTVDLGTIYSVNPSVAGKNYGLSFCPNGKQFPKN